MYSDFLAFVIRSGETKWRSRRRRRRVKLWINVGGDGFSVTFLIAELWSTQIQPQCVTVSMHKFLRTLVALFRNAWPFGIVILPINTALIHRRRKVMRPRHGSGKGRKIETLKNRLVR